MKWSGCLSDDSAVAPIISTILMVAITVILAAVVTTFALGFADSTETAPPASFSGEQVEKHLIASHGNEADFKALKITYRGGKTIEKDRIDVLVNGKEAWGVLLLRFYPNANNCNFPCHRAWPQWAGSGTITAGDSVTVVHKDDPNLGIGTTYSIDPNGEDDPATSELYPNTVPANPDARIDLNAGDTVQVVWESRTGAETAVLFEQKIE